MKKILGSLFIIVIALLVIVVIGRNAILKAAIEQGGTKLTGFKTTVESVKFDFPSIVQIKGLVIRNPEGFHDKVFANIPEIYANLVLQELLRGQRLHLPEVRLDLQEIRIEKNEKGVSNVELLSSLGGKPAGKPAEAAKPSGEQKPPMPFLLEKFQLTIRKVSFQDRSGLMGAAPLPKKMEVDLNVQNEVITNITDAKTLVNIIIAKVLNGATLGRLLNIDPQQLLNNSLSGAMGTGKELAGQMTQQVGNVTGQAKDLIATSQVSQKAESLVQGSTIAAKDILGDASGAAKTQVSGLFGKLKSLQPGEETVQQQAATS